MTGPSQYLFITPVWGELYVDRFVKVCLPSQLSSGNLGAIPPGKGLFLVYTRREHARTITRSPAWRRLKTMMPVAVKSLDDLPDPRFNKNPHELQTAAYMRGLRAGAGTETAFVFLTPDILVGDGTYRSMVRLAEAGKRIHLVAGIRMLAEGAVSCVVQHRGADAPAVTIPCRDLVRSCLDNLHPIAAGHVVTGGRVQAAEHLYWRIGATGLLARGFHIHPLFVWPRNPDAVIRNTLDDEYVSRACPDRADWHTVTDSDEMCVIEFSDRLHKAGMVEAEPLDDPAVAEFLRHRTTPDHREHVRHRIQFHTGGLDHAEWSRYSAESDSLVERYLELHARGPVGVAEDEIRARIQVVHSAGAASRIGWGAWLRFLAAPFRFANRIINLPLYRYLDRLNATVLFQQKQLDQAHNQLTNVSRIAEELMERIERTEELAKAAAIREADASFLRLRRRRKSRGQPAAG